MVLIFIIRFQSMRTLLHITRFTPLSFHKIKISIILYIYNPINLGEPDAHILSYADNRKLFVLFGARRQDLTQCIFDNCKIVEPNNSEYNPKR